ncbi:MAG: AAA family ATPase [Pyrinomonadaceae bacterium]
MTARPKCVIVTGRPGAGKATLCKKLQPRLWMPVVSRDEIKEGYVNTFGLKHDRLPPNANGIATEIFFGIVNQYLANKVSIIIEAAFQHKVWEPRLIAISALADPLMIICDVDAETAANRHLQRGLAEPEREFYHGDKRVVVFRETGEILPAAGYETPHFDVPTIPVSTVGEYSPPVDEIIAWIRRSSTE